MKPVFRLRFAAVATAAGLLLYPATTLAVVTTPTQSAFCNGLGSRMTSVNAEIARREAKITADRAAYDAKLTSDRAKVNATVASDRAKADALRQAHYDKLTADATTTAQKQAVVTFEATVDAAITTRRQGMDAARAVFRSGVDRAIAMRRSQVDAAIQTFLNSVAAASTAAKAGCQSGQATDTVRANFVAAMHNARTTLTATLRAIPTLGSSVKNLAATRNQAFAQIQATFKTTIQQAAAALKAALGQG